MENLKKILKPMCNIIVIPFVRFKGYWLDVNDSLTFEYIPRNSVEDFPKIKLDTISNYLCSSITDIDKFKHHFNKELYKLKEIEKSSDLEFYEFFINNHIKIPLFRDCNHPTMNLINYLGIQLVNKISVLYKLDISEIKYELKTTTFEYGHYKPIQNGVKDYLNIEYDLDKIFIVDRETYLKTILTIENKKININDLNQLLPYFDRSKTT